MPEMRVCEEQGRKAKESDRARFGGLVDLAKELGLYPLAIFIWVLNSEQLIHQCLLCWDELHFPCTLISLPPNPSQNGKLTDLPTNLDILEYYSHRAGRALMAHLVCLPAFTKGDRKPWQSTGSRLHIQLWKDEALKSHPLLPCLCSFHYSNPCTSHSELS